LNRAPTSRLPRGIIAARRLIGNAAANTAIQGGPVVQMRVVLVLRLWVTTLTNQKSGRSIKAANQH
jgi:hypothetical protein